ncbi:MAG: PQQ-dependent sugar dehydrogenase [Isosphaeraceae bacterium]|nr:PQQ-dependent sugar dehydrogenase [Isosphaeraceae bacterium]
MRIPSTLAITGAILSVFSSVAEAQSLPQLKTEVAFPNLQFTRPVAFADPNDGSNLFYVNEQPGRIFSFAKDPATREKELFLDIRSKVNSKGNEEGLLGLAFHPKYKENGRVFVYYSWMNPRGERYSVVSSFQRSKTDPRKADPESEKRIWVSAKDPFENHNGGCLLFGPDGYLYISLGDSGAANDPLKTGQNPKDWWGSILRIDVDSVDGDKPYTIPKDNPKLRDPKRFGHWAPEVYCIGLRNVWKFSFDKENGKLWAGDVGQNLWELVYIIENGGNYGWSIKEGTHAFAPRLKRDTSGPITPPIAEYPHNESLDPNRKDVGVSITGGYVYRGKAIPELVGAYVYGDYQTGRIWGLREKDGKAVVNQEIVDLKTSRPLNIAGFGEDAAGELYILAFDGRIHRLVPR